MSNFLLQHLDTIGAALFSLVFYFIVGSMAWQKMGDRMENFDSRIEEVEKKINTMQPMWEEIRGRLIAIETSIRIHFKNK